MKRFIFLISLIATISATGCKDKEYEIKWDYTTCHHVTSGVYGRIKAVDNRFALVYDTGGVTYIRWSDDKCETWSEPQEVARGEGYGYTNCELIQLSNHRLLYMWNARPKAPNLPYKIMAATSDDKGATWHEQTIYIADTLSANGCWEPIALELPDGEVQLYFANEYPYKQTNEQEITMMRSTDGGNTWSEPNKISMSSGSRDGMPVPIYLPHSQEIAVAIEDNGIRGLFKPVIIRSADKWQDGCVGQDDIRREEALAQEWRLHDTIYAGAPYLIRLGDKHTVLSIQSTEERQGRDHKFANMQVYVGDRDARNFRNKTTPMTTLLPNGNALWNSLCAIDSQTVIAVMSVVGAENGKNGIWTVKGKLSEVYKSDY